MLVNSKHVQTCHATLMSHLPSLRRAGTLFFREFRAAIAGCISV